MKKCLLFLLLFPSCAATETAVDWHPSWDHIKEKYGSLKSLRAKPKAASRMLLDLFAECNLLRRRWRQVSALLGEPDESSHAAGRSLLDYRFGTKNDGFTLRFHTRARGVKLVWFLPSNSFTKLFLHNKGPHKKVQTMRYNYFFSAFEGSIDFDIKSESKRSPDEWGPVLDMRTLIHNWNPMFQDPARLIALAGEPSKKDKNSISYIWDTGTWTSIFVFLIRKNTIIGIGN